MTMPSPARLSRAVAAVGLFTALAACNNDPGSGTVTVNYSFDPITSCNEDQETVIDIEVEIGDDVATDSVSCENGGGDLTVTAPAGTYDIVVRGIDDVGDVVVDNLGGETSDDRIEIIGGDTLDFPVVLGLVPATLEVNLSVRNNGVFAQCTSDAITIKGLRAQAWGFSGQLKTHDFDLCDFDDFLPVPDDMREINGRLFDRAVLQPLDASGNPVGDPYDTQFAAPIGAGKSVRLAIECEDDSCDVIVLEGDPGPSEMTTTDDPTGGDPTGGGDTDPGTTGGDPTGGDETGGDSTGA